MPEDLAQKVLRVAKVMLDYYGPVVRKGPFAGMRLVHPSRINVLSPKILGCYEQELHPVIQSFIFPQHYDRIINLGCAEGYYAVGLALCKADTPVYAFDINPLAQEMCREMALANQVDGRIMMEGECTLERLNQLTREGHSLIFCDIEGSEIDLLQPNLVPGLLSSDLLVELHDFLNPHISPTIASRFANTHDITWIPSVERDPAAYPELHILNAEDRFFAVWDCRPAMQWTFMRKKGKAEAKA